MVKNPNLPQEIVIDIFSRLPAKSIGRCRCLSREWGIFLSDPEFIKTHFNRNPVQESLILVTPDYSIHTTASVEDGTISKVLELPVDYEEVNMVLSCDGLVLLVYDKHELLLLNPTTQQHVKIPQSPVDLERTFIDSSYGFAYDSSCDDYKIVTLSHMYYGNYVDDDEDGDEYVSVHVFSLKKGSWSSVETRGLNRSLVLSTTGTLLNGAFHWVTSIECSCPPEILAFHLVDEAFSKLPLPNVNVFPKFVWKLVVLDGFLCMVDGVSASGVDIWILKDYGFEESWTNFFKIECGYDFMDVDLLCSLLPDEVVLVVDEERLAVYNLKERTLKDMVVDGVPARFKSGKTFMESLISPAFGNTGNQGLTFG